MTVDVETGLLNTVDEFKGALGPPMGDQVEMSAMLPSAKNSAREEPEAQPPADPAAPPWLWGLLALPVAAMAWAIIRAKATKA